MRDYGKRAYFNEEKSTSFRFDLDPAKIDRTQIRPSEIFGEFSRQLKEKYDINRSVLILINDEDKTLSAISTWHEGKIRDGLSINLPKESSLFDKVAENGILYTENFCGVFSGNFFERKLLLDDESQSFALQPLKHEGKVIGLVGFSSESPAAFSIFEEGCSGRSGHDGR